MNFHLKNNLKNIFLTLPFGMSTLVNKITPISELFRNFGLHQLSIYSSYLRLVIANKRCDISIS